MNVTPLSKSPAWMSAALINPKRFDTGYYDPSLTVAESLMREGKHVPWKRLGKIGRVYNFGAYELTNSISFVDKSTPGAVPFVTVTNINNLTVDFDAAPWIDQASHHLLSASICRPGIVMVSIAGTIGRAGVVPSTFPECNGNQAIAKIAVNDEESDPHFLAAYLTTRVGSAASEREAAGAVQKNLYIYNVEEIPVPCPHKPIRTAIGNKVRAAERLKADANGLWNHVRDHVRSLIISIEPPPPPAYSAAFVYEGFTPRRIDADYYRRSDLDLRRAFKKAGFVQLGSVCASMESGSTPRRPGSAVRIAGVGSIRVPTIKPSAKFYHLETGAVRVRCGDVLMCNAAHDASFIGRMSGVVGEDSNLVASSEVLVCRPESSAHSLVIVHFLNSRYGYVQIQRAVRGMTAHLYAEDMAEVLVPPLKDEYSSHEAMLRDLTSQWREAEKLTASAIVDVENLIDGKLDEDQCLAEGRKLAEEFGLEVP